MNGLEVQSGATYENTTRPFRGSQLRKALLLSMRKGFAKESCVYGDLKISCFRLIIVFLFI